jgi:Uma2 family endonuclease
MRSTAGAHPSSRPGPDRSTVAQYAALPEDSDVRYELAGGVLLIAPRPTPAHQYCLGELLCQLRDQVPAGLQLLPAVDIDLELAAPDEPGFVRVPDLVIVTADALTRVNQQGGLLRASEVVLAVEIVSLGSRRRKDHEYADAGIPHYWVLHIEDRVSLVASHLADDSPTIGVFTTDDPFPARLDLDALTW